MIEVDPDQLKQAVEGLHNCKAKLSQAVEGHPRAKHAYAWSSAIEGSDKRKFYAVLDLPPITSPVEAVRASIASDYAQKRISGGKPVMT